MFFSSVSSTSNYTPPGATMPTTAPPVPPPVAVAPPVHPVALPTTISLVTMQEYYAREPRLASNTYELVNAPLGMRIHPVTGYLRWTPDHTQVGTFTVTLNERSKTAIAKTKTLTFTVTLGAQAPAGVYVVPGTGTGGAGTLANPYKDIQTAAKTLKAGDTLYIRGGLYQNANFRQTFVGRTRGNYAQISKLVGTQASPITIKPFGNEYVTINSDMLGFAIKDSEWLNIEGIEFRGDADNISYDDAVNLWWVVDNTAGRTGASGMSINTCFHIKVSKCIITYWPGSGITHNYGEYIFIEDNVIAHNARWSTAGVHGWNNSKPGSGKKENVDDIKMAARRNLVIASQQCIPSRVTAKGFAELLLDEGGGLHSQAQPVVATEGGVVFGYWHVTDNLVAYCGKSAINQNATGNLVVERNSCYKNAQNTSSSDIHLSPAKKGEASYGMNEAVVRNNLVHSLPTARSINRIGDPALQYVNLEANYIAQGGDPANADYVANTPIEEVPQVFQDPANLNFKRHSSIPSGFGVNDDVIDWLMQRAEEFDVKIEKCPINTDAAYVAKVKQDIFDKWPAPAAIDSEFGPNFELHDPATDYHYVYSNKHKYPNDPKI